MTQRLMTCCITGLPACLRASLVLNFLRAVMLTQQQKLLAGQQTLLAGVRSLMYCTVVVSVGLIKPSSRACKTGPNRTAARCKHCNDELPCLACVSFSG